MTVLDDLLTLAERSLIVSEEQDDGRTRYRILEPLRAYALDRASEQGEVEPTADRVVAFLRERTRSSPAEVAGFVQDERETIRAIVSLAEDLDAAAALIGFVAQRWMDEGWWEEGQAMLEGMLARAEGRASSDITSMWRALAWLRRGRGDFPGALAACDAALDMARGLDDLVAIADASRLKGGVLHQQGDPEAGRAAMQEGVDAARDCGAPLILARALMDLALPTADLNDLGSASALLEEAAEIFATAGDSIGEASCYVNLARIRKMQGEVDTARDLADRAATLLQPTRAEMQYAMCMLLLGQISMGTGDTDRALKEVGESCDVLRRLDSPLFLGSALIDLGHLREEVGNDAGRDAAWEESLACFTRLGMQKEVEFVRALLAGEEHRLREEVD